MSTNHRRCGRSLLLLAALVGLSSAGPARAGTLQVTVTLRAMTGHLVVAPPGRSTQADTSVTYLFLLHNTVTTPESFRLRLTCPSRWQAKLGNGRTDTQGPLAPGQIVVIPVVVTPPKRIAVGATGTVTLSAVTIDRPQFGDADSVTTTIVGSGAGAGLAPAPFLGGAISRGPASPRTWGAQRLTLSGSQPAWERLLSRAQAHASSAETPIARLPEVEAAARGAEPSKAAPSSTARGADTAASQGSPARKATPLP